MGRWPIKTARAPTKPSSHVNMFERLSRFHPKAGTPAWFSKRSQNHPCCAVMKVSWRVLKTECGGDSRVEDVHVSKMTRRQALGSRDLAETKSDAVAKSIAYIESTQRLKNFATTERIDHLGPILSQYRTRLL
jgi:hypothetical protein